MPGKSWRIFRIWGIDVYIHFSLLFILALFSLSLGLEFVRTLKEDFPATFSNPEIVGWALGIITAISLFISVLLHEFGHSLVAKLFGMRVLGITLFALGGVSRIDELERATARRSFLITAVGPFVSLVLGVIFLLIYNGLEGAQATRFSTPIFLVAMYLAYINFALAVFNTIPAYPLDGGRIFLAALQLLGIGRRRANGITSFVGIAISSLFIFVGFASIIGILPLATFSGIWLAIIGAFLISVNLSERRRYQ